MNNTRLALNIELTDEQYQELMSKSLDTVLNTEQVQAAITELILKHIGDYLQMNKGAITTFVEPPSYYGNRESDQHKKIVKNLFDNATKEYQETISKAVKDYMTDLLTKVDSDKLMQSVLHEVLVTTTQDALRDTVSNNVQDIWDNIIRQNNAITSLADRLNVSRSDLGVY